MNFNFQPSDLPGLVMLLLVGGFWLVCLIVHICLALAVWHDSRKMVQVHRRGTFLVGGGIWALATLLGVVAVVGGVVVVGIYWAIHHSTLRPPPLAEKPPGL